MMGRMKEEIAEREAEEARKERQYLAAETFCELQVMGEGKPVDDSWLEEFDQWCRETFGDSPSEEEMQNMAQRLGGN